MRNLIPVIGLAPLDLAPIQNPAAIEREFVDNCAERRLFERRLAELGRAAGGERRSAGCHAHQGDALTWRPPRPGIHAHRQRR
jgi:hypothetical protein